MSIRSALFWVHLTCGLVAGSVILLMSVTGVLLTLQKQMTEWADREYWVAPALPNQRAALADLLVEARHFDPDANVSSITIYSDPMAPAAVSLGGGRTLYLDPSSAEVRGENGTRMRAFFQIVVGWHRWFNVSQDRRSTGRSVTGWSNVIFLFLLLSGLYMWVPRRWAWKHLRPILLLNPRAKGKARDFNWHHVFGFWTAIPLALVVASATVISFPWASDLAYRAMGESPPQRVAGPASTRSVPPTQESARQRAQVLEPKPFEEASLNRVLLPAISRVDDWRTITFTLPADAAADVHVRIDQGWGGEPQKRHTLTYDADTGIETAYSTFQDQSPGRRLRTFLRFTHTGEYYGIWGQIVAGVASLAGVFLVWSGVALALRRLRRFVRGADPSVDPRPQV